MKKKKQKKYSNKDLNIEYTIQDGWWSLRNPKKVWKNKKKYSRKKKYKNKLD